MGLFDIFTKGKREKENQKILEGATFDECLEDLFADEPDETKLKRARLFQLESKNMKDIPRSRVGVYWTLLHYHNLCVKNKDIAAKNVINSVYNLICEADLRNPYEAKALQERLFAKWREIFHYAMRYAEKEDSEANLVFLCCINLFDWDELADKSKIKGYLEKIHALDEIKNFSAYEWLKCESLK